MFKKSFTKDEGKLKESDLIQANSSEKKRSKRYSTVKSEELAEIFKAKDVAKETEKLIQKEKEKEKERINGFTEWVHRKRAISDRQKIQKDKFLSFGKSRDSNAGKSPQPALENLKQLQMDPYQEPEDEEYQQGSYQNNKSEEKKAAEPVHRSSLHEIQEFQNLLSRIVEGDHQEEEEENIKEKNKSKTEIYQIENLQSEIKAVSYDLDKLNKIFDLPRLFKEEDSRTKTEEKKPKKRYSAIGSSADRNDFDEVKLEAVFRRSFLNQVKHWETIDGKDEEKLNQHYKKTLKDMQNNLRKLNTSELITYYKFLVQKARFLFTKFMREHALANQIM
jgi:hypothetical protein